MDEKQHLIEELGILEMKLLALQRQIRNIRAKLDDLNVERKPANHDVSFFTACKAEDDYTPIATTQNQNATNGK